jgi:permuted papain-like amidase YaeF/Yiix C92 family enzyme
MSKWTSTLRRPLNIVNGRLRRTVACLLNQRVAEYELRVPNDMTRLYRQIRKGDVVLVEGELRVSQLIKYTTQSPWSHSALYVGDELLRRGGRLREQALASFGELADRLLIEALTEEGVVSAPLAKYASHNLRVCRPFGISAADLDKVIDSVLTDLGKPYDNRNLFDLMLTLLSPIKVGPLRRRSVETCLGNCTDLQVICSGMIAKAFHRVGFPILPSIEVRGGESGLRSEPFPSRFPPRHYSQITPRDFDLSPNFEIVKLDVGGEDGSTPNSGHGPSSKEGQRSCDALASVT